MMTDKKESFNVNHPELQEGEMFLENIQTREDWSQIGYGTKRRGMTAYDICDHLIRTLTPVFIQISEFKEKNDVSKS